MFQSIFAHSRGFEGILVILAILEVFKLFRGFGILWLLMPIFWQKGPMAEEAQQYEKGEERKQQSKDHWARMVEIMVHKPTK